MGWDEIFRAATFYFFPRARFGSSFSSFLALVRAPNYSSFRRFFKEKRKSVLASCCVLLSLLLPFLFPQKLLSSLAPLSLEHGCERRARERQNKSKQAEKREKGKEVVGSGRRSRFVVVFVGRPGRFITPLVKSFVSTVPFAPAFAWPLRPSGFRHKKHIRLLSLSLSLSLSFSLSFFLSFSLLSLSRRRRRVEIANRKKSVKKERENTIFHSEFPILLSHEKMTH